MLRQFFPMERLSEKEKIIAAMRILYYVRKSASDKCCCYRYLKTSIKTEISILLRVYRHPVSALLAET